MPSRERLSVPLINTVLDLSKRGLSSAKISLYLSERHQVSFSARGVRTLLTREKSRKIGEIRSTSCRRPRLLQRKLSDIHVQFIDLWMTQNREFTSQEIKDKLEIELDVSVSKRCVNYYRRRLGWTGKQMQYCQLISEKNIGKRFDFSVKMLAIKEDFRNVIFTDETSVEMSSNGRLAFYKLSAGIDRLPPKAPKPKHAYKVHVWGGISYRGRTHICIFTGIMDSIIYQQILRDCLLPFVRDVFPDGYRFYQDNDSKHKSKSTMKWMEENGVKDKLIETPASSPDLNPIENLWSSMKDFVQRKVKPKKKDELVKGIQAFWEALTPEKCGRYIDHIHKVLPVVVINDGEATEF